MNLGTRVQVHIPPANRLVRSTFHGAVGVIVGDAPMWMVLLDGEEKPLRFGSGELLPVLADPEPITAGG